MKNEKNEMTQMNLLSAFEQIVLLSENSKLSPEFYEVAAQYIDYVSEKLGLTPTQSVLMSIFVDKYEERCITNEEFCNHLNCRPITILRLSADFEELVKRELIRCHYRNEHNIYSVSQKVIASFKKNENYAGDCFKNLSFDDFFDELNDIFTTLDEGSLSFDRAVEKIHRMLDDNPELEFVKQVSEYNFDLATLMVFLAFAHMFVNKNDDNVIFDDLDMLFNDSFNYMEETTRELFESKMHPLFSLDIIENGELDYFMDFGGYHFTDKAKAKFFPHLYIKQEKRIKVDKPNTLHENFIEPESITAKELYHSRETQMQLTTLSQLLNVENYANVCERLKSAGMRSGVTCIFYGAPGTGKTESVMQLARTTGRAIVQVDLSQIRDKYVGESEHNIKAIFDRYREIKDKCEFTPILLFNEADGIIGKRLEKINQSTDSMENTIQNIILQEMETFEGILIATTNLKGNMDKAFERRFLYKVEFKKPTIEARKSIWHSMIPALDDTSLDLLAHKYDFSGGQIENVARHYIIDKVLLDKEDDITRLMQHCDSENWLRSSNYKLGY